MGIKKFTITKSLDPCRPMHNAGRGVHPRVVSGRRKMGLGTGFPERFTTEAALHAAARAPPRPRATSKKPGQRSLPVPGVQGKMTASGVLREGVGRRLECFFSPPTGYLLWVLRPELPGNRRLFARARVCFFPLILKNIVFVREP